MFLYFACNNSGLLESNSWSITSVKNKHGIKTTQSLVILLVRYFLKLKLSKFLIIEPPTKKPDKTKKIAL